MHFILAFPFQPFCKQESYATLEVSSALHTPARAPARHAVVYRTVKADAHTGNASDETYRKVIEVIARCVFIVKVND
jgi:hypothetical protein